MDEALNRGIQTFHDLLQRSWVDVAACAAAATYDGMLNDWLQGNWELIVEATLSPRVHLEIYGEGADCNDRSSRVLFPGWIATHRVVCRPLDGVQTLDDVLNRVPIPAQQPLYFEEFVTMRDGWYYREPPFDFVLIETDGVERIVRRADVVFHLQEIQEIPDRG